MDKLKSAIADKVLEISSLSGEDMKARLEKINRFRDFSDACKSLTTRYPAIEDELLRMVENNDFDTKIASSRVDTIIRLSETNTPNNKSSEEVVENDISELEEITQNLPLVEEHPLEETIIEAEEKANLIHEPAVVDKALDEGESTENSLEKTVDKTLSSDKKFIENNNEPEKYLPEDIDYEEVIDEDKEYVDFEEINEQALVKQDTLISTSTDEADETIKALPDNPQRPEFFIEANSSIDNLSIETSSSLENQTELNSEDTNISTPSDNQKEENSIITESINKETEDKPTLNPVERTPITNSATSSIKKQTGATKENAKRALQATLIIAIIIALIFIIVFIIQNTEIFLWGFGVTVLVVGVIWLIIKKNKKESE